MIFSLPSYRRLSDMDLARLRRDDERNPSRRAMRMLLNLLLLSGLWGMPLYARWLVVADQARGQPLSEAVLGKWWRDEEVFLEFTPDRHLRLCREEGLIESAEYQIVGDMLWVSDFRRRDLLAVEPQCFRISLRGNQLILTPAKDGFTARGRDDRSSLRTVLPAWEGATVQFQRGKSR